LLDNDDDPEGWVTMKHADDRPLPPFIAAYDEESKSLNAKVKEFFTKPIS